MQPGETRNPLGSSERARFRAAVRRALKKRMREGDVDELDLLGEEVVALALAKNKTAAAILREVWAREDGPHQTRLAGPNGEAITPLVLFNVDAEAMREGRAPEQCPPTPSEAPPSS